MTMLSVSVMVSNKFIIIFVNIMKPVYILCFLFIACQDLTAQDRLSNPSKFLTASQSAADLTLSRQGMTHALILVDSCIKESELFAHSIMVNAKFANIWSVQLPAENLEVLGGLSGVKYVEVASKANAARFKNDIERQATSADKVQNGTQNGLPANYNGKGVVMGIVDIGFQCNHPTFYTNDGSRTRIKRYWQQNNFSGTPPQGFSYGTEITDTTLVQLANDMDGTHGTHVAGIAAGSGFTSPGLQYRGVAPEADLVFVSIKYSNDTLGGSALGDYLVANPTILDAYKYIFDYAQSVGKPAVINLSWGMHTGPHDGTSLFDKATESLVGPGKILVGANGNEGDNPMHWHHKFNHDTVGTIMIENGRQFRKGENVYADFWGSANSRFSLKIQIIDTNKTLVAETPFINSLSEGTQHFKFTQDSAVFKISIACEQKNPNNDKPNITVMASHNHQTKYLIVARICSDTALVHGWNSGSAREWTSGSFHNKVNQVDFENQFIDGNTDYTVGENGGTSKVVISVGAFAARSAYVNIKGKLINDSGYVIPGNIAKFSSKGPTVDGRIKPDVSAPGYDVPSSINNKQVAGWMPDKTLLKTSFRNDSNYWTAFNGTSMAAPHVSGIVALMLEANPSLSAAQAREILTSTATTDTYTGTTPNQQYGYGKVNALAAVTKALQYAGINEFFTGKGLEIFPNPSTGMLYITLPLLQSNPNISIVGMDGRTIVDIPNLASFGTLELNTDFLDSGIYFIRLHNGGQLFISKFVKI
jgi:minor extracellular serine protease Vpr